MPHVMWSVDQPYAVKTTVQIARMKKGLGGMYETIMKKIMEFHILGLLRVETQIQLRTVETPLKYCRRNAFF
jgi:hypothetical protein